ncbi:MAG TPA: hypothetical protein V6C98_11270 [Thermosynechococcaceae cyanobacterium]|jgi:hypothetical protein
MKTDKRSPITQQLVQTFRDLKEGEFISYEDLNAIANCDVQKRYRHFIETACGIVQKEYSVVLRCEIGRGFTRLANKDISRHANDVHGKRLKSDTQIYRQKIECVEPAKLTHSQRVEYGLSMAYLGLREAFSTKDTDKALRERVIKSPEQMLDKQALIEDLRAFK